MNKKLKTESGDPDIPPDLIQESLNIDKISSKYDDDKNPLIGNTRTIFDIVKIKDVYNQAKILNIEMITCVNNPSDNNEADNVNTKRKIKTNIEITPLGYINSKRKKDGITFFGFSKEKNGNDIDISINPLEGENNVDEKFFGKHFQIKFNPEDLNYYLRDLGHGFGTFVRINSKVEIKNNFLLNIGENYLIFSLGKDNNENENDNDTLNIKLFNVSSGQTVFDFKKENSPITIGRKPGNNIYIEDNMLSRIHCTLFNKEDKWFLVDGSINDEDENDIKKSTNGSWIYAFEDTVIYDKMSFKESHYLFECNLIDALSNSNNNIDNSYSNKINDLNIL